MKMTHVVGGVAMALALLEPAAATEAASGVKSPCPILRPMSSKCPPEGRVAEPAVTQTTSSRLR